MLSKTRHALQAGKTLVGHWHGIGSPLLAETVTATCDYDVLVVDCQHGIIDAAGAMAVMASVRGNAVPWVRLRDSQPSHIHHALDAGALGLIAPLINTAEDAAVLVRESTYPPRGTRSFGPVRAGLLAPDYFTTVDDAICRWAMIETAAALENVEAIVAVEGITGVFIGPNDLSLALGIPPSSSPQHPTVISAIARIREAAHAKGKKAGIFCGDGTFAKTMADQGFDFVIAGTDGGLLAAAAARELNIVRGGLGDAGTDAPKAKGSGY